MAQRSARPPRILVFCPHIQSNRPRAQRLNDSPRRKAVTPSPRPAALRSTALGDKPGAGRGIVGTGRRTPGPNPKSSLAEAAADRAQRRAQDRAREHKNAAPRQKYRSRCGAAPAAAALAPATRQHAALPPPRKPPPTSGRGGRDVVDLAGRYRCAGERHRPRAQAQAGGCHPGRSGHLRSGGKETRRMDHPAQRRQRRVGRALSRLHRRPTRAGPRRPSCAGASRRRCGTTIATTPRYGRGSKTNRRCRPRASSRWRG